MSTVLARVAKKPELCLPMASKSAPHLKSVWHPSQGIVFRPTLPVSESHVTRASNTMSRTDREHKAIKVSHYLSEDSYVMATTPATRLTSSLAPPPTTESSNCLGDKRSVCSTDSTRSKEDDEGTDNAHPTDEIQESFGANHNILPKPITFHIAKNALKRAKEATPGTKESYWTYKMYLGPEGQDVKVHYCKSKHTAERVAQYFLDEKVIGFDIEWKPDSNKNSGIKRNVSLIQLASETRIGLFHIAVFAKNTSSDLVAPTLKRIMEDNSITKVGVAIKADCTRLRNYLQIESRGIFELSHLYNLVRYSSSGEVSRINKKLVSLSTQAKEHLQLPVFKGEVRGSDWTQPLTMEQIIYAASDAYANFMLYDVLEAKRKELQPVPPRPHHAELNLPIRLICDVAIPITEEVFEGAEHGANRDVVSSEMPTSVLERSIENGWLANDSEPK